MPAHISKLPRREDWQTSLHHSLLDHHHQAFAWGSHDCALAVCRHIQAVTGVDVGAPFRGHYTDQASAAAFMASYTGKTAATLEDVAVKVAADYDLKEIAPAFAQRGDVVLFDMPNGEQSLAVVHLNGIHAIGAGAEGLRKIKVRTARRAWRIGVDLRV